MIGSIRPLSRRGAILMALVFSVVAVCALTNAQVPVKRPYESEESKIEKRRARSVADTVELHAIGIYDPPKVWKRTDAGILYRERAGNVGVRVKESSSPIALWLSAGNYAIWNIDLEPGAEIVKVIIGGSTGQEVKGLPRETQILDRTDKKPLDDSPFGVPMNEHDERFSVVLKNIRKVTGLDIHSLQSVHSVEDYQGNEFVIRPGRSPSKQTLESAEVHAIRLYEGAYRQSVEERRNRRFEDPIAVGTAEVKIGSSTAPIVLVLMAYEPIVWKLDPQPNANIVLVILGGYHKPSVVGEPPNTPVIVRYFQEHAEAEEIVRRLTGSTFTSSRYSYAYDGVPFVVPDTKNGLSP